LNGVRFKAVQEPVFWAGVRDQWLSTTLDQNSALLIGLWQNHDVQVKKKHFKSITLLSFQKHHSSFSFGYSEILKFIMVSKTKYFLKLILTTWHKPVYFSGKQTKYLCLHYIGSLGCLRKNEFTKFVKKYRS
jgi:hypothetical protein